MNHDLDYGYAGFDDLDDGYVSGIGDMGVLAYAPDLGPVGTGAAGDYYPRDTTQDANALQYLGFMPLAALDQHVGTLGSQAADMAASQGAWDPAFQAAVRAFQAVSGATQDGWIGPQTRTRIAAAVALKNANPAPNPNPLPPPPIPPNILPVPPLPIPLPPGPTPPNIQPVVNKTTDDTMMYVGIGLGALVLAGVGYWALSD